MEPRKHSWREWLAIVSALLTAILAVPAQAVVLQWEANPEPDVVGYRVYMGQVSRSYSTTHEAGSQTNAEITALQPGKTFYFAVTAYNEDGLESDFSEEISYTIPVPNHAPIAAADTYTTMRNHALTITPTAGVLTNDADADGDALTVMLANGPIHGSLTLEANGAFNYVPMSDFTGTDTFNYHATDGASTSSPVTVIITVLKEAPLECGNCFNRIAEFLTAHGAPLPAGTVLEGDCMTKTARLLERTARIFQKDPTAVNDLLAIGDCLNSAIDDRLAEQRGKALSMYPSRWSAAATNGLNALPTSTSEPNPLVMARAIVRRARGLHRVEGFIARGTVVPTSLDGRVIAATLIEDGRRERFTISLFDGAWFTTVPMSLGTDWGVYRFEQTAWNLGILELETESGNTLNLQLTFKGSRAAISGPKLRGWFIFQ
jgi:hypothetical protein